MTGCIVGWAHGKFGRHEGVEVEDLITEVAAGALADAGVAPADVDEIFIGHFNGGFVMQDFPASLVLQAHPDLRFKPATRVENACATGSAAIFQGLNSIAAKKARIVLCVGVEKMTELAGEAIGELLTKGQLRPRGRRRARLLRRHLRPHRRELLPALRRPVRRPGAHRRQEPRQRRGQSARPFPEGSRLRVLPPSVGQEPGDFRAAQALRLLARDRRRGRRRPRRRRDRDGDEQGRAVPRRRPRQRLPADVEARRHPVRGPGAGLAGGLRAGRHHDRRSRRRRGA